MHELFVGTPGSTSLATPSASQQTSQSVRKGSRAKWKSRQMDRMAEIDYADTATPVAGLTLSKLHSHGPIKGCDVS